MPKVLLSWANRLQLSLFPGLLWELPSTQKRRYHTELDPSLVTRSQPQLESQGSQLSHH